MQTPYFYRLMPMGLTIIAYSQLPVLLVYEARLDKLVRALGKFSCHLSTVTNRSNIAYQLFKSC